MRTFTELSHMDRGAFLVASNDCSNQLHMTVDRKVCNVLGQTSPSVLGRQVAVVEVAVQRLSKSRLVPLGQCRAI